MTDPAQPDAPHAKNCASRTMRLSDPPQPMPCNCRTDQPDAAKAASCDLLDMNKLNALHPPLMAHLCGGSPWEIHDIDVQTGLLRVLVCGLLDVHHFSDLLWIEDGCGARHEPDDFYVEESANAAR